MGEQLGSATLELDVDLKPLDRGLASAERRVAVSVAAMQRMLDSLDAELDLRVSAAGAVAERLAASAVPRAGETVIVERQTSPGLGGGESSVWGIRGPQHAGSLTNPIVTVLAASKLFPMGSYAAAVGEDNATDVQRGDQSSGIASASDLAALTAAVNDLAQNVTPGNQLASAGEQGVAEPGGPERTVVALDAANGDALRRAADALESTAASLSKSSSSSTGGSATPAMEPAWWALLKQYRTAPSASRSQTVITDSQTTINGGTTIINRPAGGGTSGFGAIAGSSGGRGNSTGGPFVLIPGAGGTGGGGNKRVDVFYHSSGGGDNGGGAGDAATTGLLTRLGLGGGIAGLAAFGSALSFAGLGFEHLLTVAAGLLGSATAAAGGGGLLALGALGKFGVGAATDAAGLGQAANDTKAVVQAQNSLNQAIAVYGKGSTQAAAAQAQLNYTLNSFSPIAKQAVLQAANTAQAFHQAFNAATGQAESTGAQILTQAMKTGAAFLPILGQYAAQNMVIIKQGLQPFFAWLKGPDGIGIFTNLEQLFQQELPTTVHASEQAFELIARVINIASQDTGGFVLHLNELLTRWNSMSNAQLGSVIQRYVDDFHLWDTFVKLLITDLFDLFHQDVGTGNSIIATLNGMLEKLHAYETSAHGSAQLQNIFEVHKTEIDDLLKLLPELGGAFAHVYLAIAPGAVTVMNDVVLPVLDALAQALDDLSKASPLAADALGALLIGAKFGGWSAILGQLTKARGLLFGTAAAETAVADAGAAGATGAAAGGATKIATGAGILEKGGFGLGAFLAGKGFVGAGVTAANIGTLLTTALKSAVAGLGGFLAGDFARSLLHAGQGGHSGTGSLVGSVIGGGLGSIAGPLGTAIGATAGNIIGGVIGSMIGHSPVTFHQNQGGIFTNQQLGTIKPGDAIQIKEIGNFSQYSIAQLQALQAALAKPGIKVVVNGVPEAVAAVRQVVTTALQTKQQIQENFQTAQDYISQFWRQAEDHAVRGAGGMVTVVAPKLGQIVDAFKSSDRAISNFVGLGTTEGKQLLAQNVGDMVEALTLGMAHGNVAVKQGMAALKQALAVGMSDNAITWQTQWQDMMTAVQTLYDTNKISTKTYFSDLHGIVTTGWHAIQRSTQQALNQYDNSQKVAFISGQQTFAQYQTNIHNAQLRANQLQHHDLGQWETNLIASMKKSGSVANIGMAGIVKQLNAVLGPLKATTIPVPVLAAENFGGTAPGGGSYAGTSFAGGGLMQIGQPGQAGKDSVPLNVGGTPIMVAPGEQVAVFNRHQLPIVNAALSGYGGLPGLFQQVNTPNYMASGGMVPGYAGGGIPYTYPLPPGTTLGRTDQGVDADMPVGAPIGPVGAARIMGINPNWFQGQPLLWWQLLAGPDAGRDIYLAEQITPLVSPGQTVSANQAIARFAPSGTGIEMGWATTSGSTLAAATTGYTEGEVTAAGSAFRAFLAGLSHGVITGGGLPNIATPKVSGSGALATLLQAAMSTVAHAANKYLMGQYANLSPGAGTFAGGGGLTSAGGMFNLTQLEQLWDSAGGSPSMAHLMAAIALAESSGDPSNLNASGASGLWQIMVPGNDWAIPGGSANVFNPLDNAKAAVAILARQGLGAWSTYTSGAYQQYMASGGLLPMLMAGGGLPGANLSPGGTTNLARKNAQGQVLDSKTGKVIPKQFLGAHKPKRRPAHHRKPIGPAGLPDPGAKGGEGGNTISSEWPVPAMPGSGDMQSIRGTISLLNTLLGSGSTDQSGIEWATEQLNYWPQIWAAQNPTAWAITSDPTQAVISTDPVTGQPVAPYLDQKDIDIAVGWLTQQIGWEQQMIGDITSSVPVSTALQKQIKAAIEKRQDEIKTRQADIKKRREQIEDNLKKRKALLAKIAANKQKIAVAQRAVSDAIRSGKKGQQLSTIQSTAASQISGWRSQNQGYAGQISDLEAENRLLGGAGTSVGQGGQIGELLTQDQRLSNQITGSAGLQFALGLVSNPSGQYSPDALEGVTGRGGLLGPDEVQLFGLEQQLLALSPSALQKVLAQAKAQAAGSNLNTAVLTGTTAFAYEGQTYVAGEGSGTPGMASGGMIDLNGLLSNQTARFAAMANLPEFAGTFHTGGVIPGVPGTEKLALVQSGETITPVGGGLNPQVICDLTDALRENTRETKSNTGALSSSTSRGNVSFTRSHLSSDRVDLLNVGS